MEFAVLGPLEVRLDDQELPLPKGKPRALLARLLVDAGRVVSVDALADALWGDRQPAGPAAALQVYVYNLRQAIGSASVVTRSPGYAVMATPDDLDHGRLAALIASAREHRSQGRFDAALTAGQTALALVRGEPYAEFAFEEWAQAEVARLRALVLTAHEEVHAALLDLGRQREALPSLEALVAAHPFHERLRSQLMLAMYREGRQAEALRCYAEGRRMLVDELGVDPGPELRQMEARVLAHDDGLRGPTVSPPSSSRSAPEPAAGSPLVGRAAEMDALRAAWNEAGTGHLRVVLMSGEPGIGKSALAGWVRDLVATEGGLVGRGVTHPHAGAPPYWPWVSALRDLVASDPSGRVTEAMRETAGAAGIEALWTGAPVDISSESQFALFDAVAGALARVSRTAPVLLVLEDVHWADAASLDLLRFVARAQPDARLLVVATHRPPATDDAVALLVADLVTEAAGRRIALRGLETADVARLVAQLVPAPVEPSLASAIGAATGGNPFYVRELVRLLAVDAGALDPARAAVPESVRAAVRARAARLAPRALEVLTLASFAGGEVDDAILPLLLDVDRDVVTAVLDAAADDGLMVEVEGRHGRHRFSHDIVRHAFYDVVPPRRRAETHLAMARALVDALGDGSPRRAAEIAGHFAHALDAGGAADAVVWLRRAGAQAVRSGAYADALRHLRRATFVVRSRLADDRAECEVLIEVAAAARLAADPETAQVARERARRLAKRLGDDLLAVRATEVLLAPGTHWLRRAR